MGLCISVDQRCADDHCVNDQGGAEAGMRIGRTGMRGKEIWGRVRYITKDI